MNSRRKRLHSLLSFIINVHEPSLKESAGTRCREKLFPSTASHFKVCHSRGIVGYDLCGCPLKDKQSPSSQWKVLTRLGPLTSVSSTHAAFSHVLEKQIKHFCITF